jgi:predicted CXXCH cytochrome family protein
MKRFCTLVLFSIVALIFVVPAFAEEMACTMCHGDKAEVKVSHPAMQMGCESCHSGVDSKTIPHKFEGDKGLASAAPDLCFMCHDPAMFSGKDHVHPPVMGGMCTSCHNPHGSDQEKILKTEKPDLCYECHDKANFYGPSVHPPVSIGNCNICHEPHQSGIANLTVADGTALCFMCHDQSAFEGKSVHKPVMEGKCMECHLPHASQNQALLYRRGNMLCRKCHAKIEQMPHAVQGFSRQGHPLRGRRDPRREGKIFSCLSCHVPHASQSIRLFRYPAKGTFDLCTYCHDM